MRSASLALLPTLLPATGNSLLPPRLSTHWQTVVMGRSPCLGLPLSSHRGSSSRSLGQQRTELHCRGQTLGFPKSATGAPGGLTRPHPARGGWGREGERLPAETREAAMLCSAYREGQDESEAATQTGESRGQQGTALAEWDGGGSGARGSPPGRTTLGRSP